MKEKSDKLDLIKIKKCMLCKRHQYENENTSYKPEKKFAKHISDKKKTCIQNIYLIKKKPCIQNIYTQNLLKFSNEKTNQLNNRRKEKWKCHQNDWVGSCKGLSLQRNEEKSSKTLQN